MQKVDVLYKRALKEIIKNGYESDDKRLFHKTQPGNKSQTKSVNGLLFKFDLKRDGFPLISLRKIPIQIFVAETIWFLNGDNKTEPFLKNYTKIWEAFKEEDGTVTSYGYRWRKHFGRDQIKGALEMLREDPSSRHGVVVTWDPASDSLSNGVKRRNVPCQMGFMLNIINKRLNFHSIWRSVDMMLGFPYDIAGNALLAYIFASYLGIEVGDYSHYIVNAHIYDIHYEVAKALVKREANQAMIKFNAEENWFERASNGDDNLVGGIANILEAQYTGYEAPVIRMEIVV